MRGAGSTVNVYLSPMRQAQQTSIGLAVHFNTMEFRPLPSLLRCLEDARLKQVCLCVRAEVQWTECEGVFLKSRGQLVANQHPHSPQPLGYLELTLTKSINMCQCLIWSHLIHMPSARHEYYNPSITILQMGKVKVWDYNVPSCLCLEGLGMGKHFVRLAYLVGVRWGRGEAQWMQKMCSYVTQAKAQ